MRFVYLIAAGVVFGLVTARAADVLPPSPAPDPIAARSQKLIELKQKAAGLAAKETAKRAALQGAVTTAQTALNEATNALTGKDMTDLSEQRANAEKDRDTAAKALNDEMLAEGLIVAPTCPIEHPDKTPPPPVPETKRDTAPGKSPAPDETNGILKITFVHRNNPPCPPCDAEYTEGIVKELHRIYGDKFVELSANSPEFAASSMRLTNSFPSWFVVWKTGDVTSYSGYRSMEQIKAWKASDN